MAFYKNIELFYCGRENDNVDVIDIDYTMKRYILHVDVSILYTDGVDEDGEWIDYTEVSRFVFDAILEKIKKEGFKQYVEKFR